MLSTQPVVVGVCHDLLLSCFASSFPLSTIYRVMSLRLLSSWSKRWTTKMPVAPANWSLPSPSPAPSQAIVWPLLLSSLVYWGLSVGSAYTNVRIRRLLARWTRENHQNNRLGELNPNPKIDKSDIQIFIISLFTIITGQVMSYYSRIDLFF